VILATFLFALWGHGAVISIVPFRNSLTQAYLLSYLQCIECTGWTNNHTQDTRQNCH